MKQRSTNPSNPLTKYDLDRVFQTPYDACFGTLEELAEAHKCTVDEIAEIADLADPVACVRAAMKLCVQKSGQTRESLNAVLFKRHTLDLLAYVLCECDDATNIEEADAAYEESLVSYDEAGNKTVRERDIKVQNGYYILENPLILATCELLGLEMYGDDRVHWREIQSEAFDLETEYVYLIYGLELENELDSDCEWLAKWEEYKEDMMRIDALLKERPQTN